ncbi:hypothetical protein R6Z07M_018389 [Ovis aries]
MFWPPLLLLSTSAFAFWTPGKGRDSLSVANAHFCFDVFKEMSCGHTIENVLLAPWSLLSALAVVLFGARGNSASQMEKVLRLNELTRTANSSNTRHALMQTQEPLV